MTSKPIAIGGDRAASAGCTGLTAGAPDPPDEFAHEVSERQQHRSPEECRGEIGDLEAPEWHLEDAGDERDRGAQRSEESADDDRQRSPSLHERLTFRNELRVP